jgi:hypothetical protein
VKPPAVIDGYVVVEFAEFPDPFLPLGYVPPPDGSASIEPIQNLAICKAHGVDGYYLLYCTADWRYVTYAFNETLAYTKRNPMLEFGLDVVWQKFS